MRSDVGLVEWMPNDNIFIPTGTRGNYIDRNIEDFLQAA